MTSGILSYLRQLLPSSEAQSPDGELLHRFRRVGDQEAFTELLRRHGPLVWGVCRRVLGDAHTAEDAFQATFLCLARKAGALRGDGSLAGWLHTVATRLAQRAGRAERRRRRREQAHLPPPPASPDDLTWGELRQILDAEIARLPEPYRQPIILCYLEDRPQIEVAHRLGLAPGVLRGRLERGRQKLRQRLEKLGLPLAAALLLTKTEPTPAALAETTRRMVCGALTGGPVPRGVADLTSSGTMLARVKLGVVAAMLLLTAGFGAGGATRREESPSSPPPPPASARSGVDALGDPLPPGAVRRLGTRRHRVQSWRVPWQDLSDGKSYLTLQSMIGPPEIHRLDAVTGRLLESWRSPQGHPVVGISADGRYALTATPDFVFFTGARAPGQKEEQEWLLTLHDLRQRKTVWQQRQMLEEKNWMHVDEACFSPDGKWIATTGEYGSDHLRLYDAATGKELWSREQKVGHLLPVGFTDGGAVLVARERNDSSITLLDRATGKERRSFRTLKQGEACQGGLTPDGSAVVFGTTGPRVCIWDLATGQQKPPLGGHQHGARCFAFSPDGKTIVTGGSDSFVLVRDWPSGRVVRTIDLVRDGVRLGSRKQAVGGVKRMAVSADGRRLEVVYEGEEALHFYELKTGRVVSPPGGHYSAVFNLALTPDGKLLSFGEDSTVHTWDPLTGECIGQLAIDQNLNAGGCTLSRDGRLLATPETGDHAVHVYDRATGERRHRLPFEWRRRLPFEYCVGAHVVFSPDGRFLAGDQRSGGLVEVWDVAGGRSMLRHESSNTGVYQRPCAFRPDGRLFAASDHDTVRFWDTNTWKERPALAAHAREGLAFSPDGRTLAAASVEGVRLFELASRRERAHLRPGEYPSGALHFSPSGRFLAWVTSFHTIRVWDIVRGKMLASFTGHDGRVLDLAFTADERAVVSASGDSTLLVWDLVGAAAKMPPPRGGDVEEAWRALADGDAKAAYEAIRVLAADPNAAVPFLARHLKPAAALDRKRIDACLRELDSDRFETRESATRALEQLGDQASPVLERFLTTKPSLEARRRVEQVLENARDATPNPEQMRQLRALEALERMGGDEARRLLSKLEEGAPEARLTQDAKSTAARMRR